MNEKKEVILYGTSIVGENFYIHNKDIKIKYCIDRQQRTNFHGVKVYNFSESIKEDIIDNKRFVIIAAHKEANEQIEKNLNDIGLIEFKDFVSANRFKKKIAILYGNCHMEVLVKYLTSNPIFAKEYTCKIYMVFRNEEPDKQMLPFVDLLITQDIRAESGYKTPSYFSEHIKDDCQMFVVPNLFGTNLFFPQYTNGFEELEEYITRNNIICEERNKADLRNYFYYTNTFYDINFQLRFKDKTIEEIAKSIREEEIYEEKEIHKRFKLEIEKIKKREEKCDIKISDYIKNNYKKKMMFYDPHHPTEEVICEKGRRILKILGIPIIEYEKLPRMIDYEETFIYGCVIKALGLDYTQEYVRLGSRDYTCDEAPMDISAWVRITKERIGN